jgi:hypothetical protein
MRRHDPETLLATRGHVPQIDDTPRGDTLQDALPAIRNPLVHGAELWDAIAYLAPRLGIHIQRDDEPTTEPMRPAFSFAPLFVEPVR